MFTSKFQLQTKLTTPQLLKQIQKVLEKSDDVREDIFRYYRPPFLTKSNNYWGVVDGTEFKLMPEKGGLDFLPTIIINGNISKENVNSIIDISIRIGTGYGIFMLLCLIPFIIVSGKALFNFRNVDEGTAYILLILFIINLAAYFSYYFQSSRSKSFLTALFEAEEIKS
jgi:hypothetical protein